MYPRMDQNKLNLVVELLQELDPRDASDVKPNREIVDHRQYSEAYLDGLMKRLEPVSTQPAPSEKPHFDFDALIERVVSSMSGNEKTKKLDFSDRVTEEEPLGNYEQYAAKIDKEGVFKSKQEFIDVLKPNAQKVAKELGIDHRLVMAQATLETGYGTKVKGHNYFGIKSHGKADGQTFITHEEVDGLMVKQKDRFRKFDTLEDSVRDYGLFLQENKRYMPLLEAKTLDEQIDELRESGYATDSKYGEKISGIIEGKTFKELLG